MLPPTIYFISIIKYNMNNKRTFEAHHSTTQRYPFSKLHTADHDLKSTSWCDKNQFKKIINLTVVTHTLIHLSCSHSLTSISMQLKIFLHFVYISTNIQYLNSTPSIVNYK